MSDRKQQILQTAIEMIADEGYSSLTMRALARASGLKLGALQYHFKTWEEMIRAMVTHIATGYRQDLAAMRPNTDEVSVAELALFLLSDSAGDSILSDKLWPQLWAMQEVEPLVGELLEEVYAEFLKIFQAALKRQGSAAPRAEALALMAMLEAESLFTARGKRWHRDRAAVHEVIMNFINTRYGDTP